MRSKVWAPRTQISPNTSRFMTPWTQIEVVRLEIRPADPAGPAEAVKENMVFEENTSRDRQADRQEDRQIGRHTKATFRNPLLFLMRRLARRESHGLT